MNEKLNEEFAQICKTEWWSFVLNEVERRKQKALVAMARCGDLSALKKLQGEYETWRAVIPLLVQEEGE